VDQALVVDGKTLAVLTTAKYREKLKQLIPRFKTRVFARVSAIQKAEIVLLLKEMNRRCFAVGDGGKELKIAI
jgi:magnesium-transporting ATPase (P-type)